MDLNPIDLKIKQFALYLKDFGLLNETNINDFLKKYKNVSENSIIPSGIFETDINVGLIYLKENLSKTMLEFYDLMTEERKKITYLNIYSKFLKKREDELQSKGNKIYNIYTSNMIKKYFLHWKNDDDKSIIKNKYINNNKNKDFVNINTKKDISYIIQDFKKDNFCFDIMSNNRISNNNNVIINSNNNRIYFNSNSSSKYNSNNNISKDIINNRNYNLNSFLLSSKNKSEQKNLYDNYQSYDNYQKMEIFENKKENFNNKEKLLDKLFQPNTSKKDENSDFYNLNNSKSTNKSYNMIRHSVNPQMKYKNMKKNNNFIDDNKSLDKYFENDEVNQRFSNNSKTVKMRNTYNSARPKSSLNYTEKNNNKSVYQRLYDQNKEKIKRQEERIKENINKIKDRANHPIQKRTNTFNNFRNNKRNKINNNNNSNNDFNHNIYSNKYKITYEGEKPNFSDKNYVSKKIDEVLFNRSLKESTKYTQKQKNNNLNDEQKRKDGKNFIDSQRKCIELFNDMIEKEEKRGNKIFNEIEKERMFKDLLNKLYDEMNNSNKIRNIDNNINEDEDEKISEYNNNDNYKKICNSVEIKLNNN